MKKLMKAVAALMLTVTLFFAMGCNKENNDSDVRVTTYTPHDITQTTAKCGGDVIVTQGLALSELGVCWGTSRNPTVEDSHLSTTNWSEPYVCTITGLELGTTYHVRAYALRGLEYYYGDDKSFTTPDYGYVNLGLPSGTLWATCNVGATTPEGYGDYFAWGETQPKDTYNWNTYKYANGTTSSENPQLTKYCNNSSYGYNGFMDNLTVLQPSDDAATANWGCDWRTPTVEEWHELYQNTTKIWTIQNGVNGYRFTASNGTSLFLPAAGFRSHSVLHGAGNCGNYWSSSLIISRTRDAWGFYFISDDYNNVGDYYGLRSHGFPVRPVRAN